MRHGSDGETLSQALDSLEREPLWHASLGSRELFHSNLIAWMSDRFPDRASRVFEPWLKERMGAPQESASREKRHLDVVLQLTDRAPLIIENKMFSLPDDDQLRQYALSSVPATGLTTPSLALLSLVEPDWADDGLPVGNSRWEWMSYRKLAKQVRESFPSDDEPFDAALIHHYSALLADLQTVADAVRLTSLSERVPGPYLMSEEMCSVLGRLREMASKIRMNRVRRWIAEELDQQDLGGKLVKFNFTNGTPLIDWTTSREPGQNSAGWQYQNGVWRLTLTLRGEGLFGDDNRLARERFARSTDWFDFGAFRQITELDDAILKREASGGFNHYNPDFIYRYRKLINPTVDEIVRLAVAYSGAAKRLKL